MPERNTDMDLLRAIGDVGLPESAPARIDRTARRALEDEIAAPGQSRRGRPRWLRHAHGLRGPSIGIAVSVMVVAAVVAVVLLHAHHSAVNVAGGRGGPSPALPSATPPKGWAELDGRAFDRVRKRDPGCRPDPQLGAAGTPSATTPTPTTTTPTTTSVRSGAPPQSLLTHVSAIRQPAPPGQRVTPQQLSRPPVRLGRVSGVYIRYARRGTIDGVTYYLIPAANVTFPFPAHCRREQLKAFRALARTRPPAQRAALVRYETAIRRPMAGIRLVYGSKRLGGSNGCDATAASLRQLPGTEFGTVGGGGDSHELIIAEVVPDGVATVTAHFSPQTGPGMVKHPITITHRVINNVIVFNRHGAWRLATITYRSADGTVLWSSSKSNRH